VHSEPCTHAESKRNARCTLELVPRRACSCASRKRARRLCARSIVPFAVFFPRSLARAALGSGGACAPSPRARRALLRHPATEKVRLLALASALYAFGAPAAPFCASKSGRTLETVECSARCALRRLQAGRSGAAAGGSALAARGLRPVLAGLGPPGPRGHPPWATHAPDVPPRWRGLTLGGPQAAFAAPTAAWSDAAEREGCEMPRRRLQAAHDCGHEQQLQAVQEPVLQGALVSWWVSRARPKPRRR
jgi:hypothetical protein